MEKQEKIDFLELFKSKIEDKDFTVYLYTPMLETNVYSMAWEEIYNICYFLNESGIKSCLITGDDEKSEYKIPDYLPDHLKNLTHLSPKKNVIEIKPYDFLIVPEFFTNVMHQLHDKGVNCEKIVLCQSHNYMIDTLPPNNQWVQWGFKNVLTTSPQLEAFIQRNSKNIYDIKTYELGIPDYFKPNEIKKPVILFYSRNINDIKRLSKLFYLKNVELSWILFERLSGVAECVTREELAKRLGETPFLVWLDKDAGFGTLPLEAMKSKTIVLGMLPDVEKNYVNEPETAVWSNSIEILAEQLGFAIKDWLLDNIPDTIYENMTNLANKHTVENHKTTFMNSFSYFVDKKYKVITETLEELLNEK